MIKPQNKTIKDKQTHIGITQSTHLAPKNKDVTEIKIGLWIHRTQITWTFWD